MIDDAPAEVVFVERSPTRFSACLKTVRARSVPEVESNYSAVCNRSYNRR